MLKILVMIPAGEVFAETPTMLAFGNRHLSQLVPGTALYKTKRVQQRVADSTFTFHNP